MEFGTLISAGSLIYCTSTKRYLFLLRSGAKHAGHWGMVGGKIEEGESITDGLFREIKEEIGMDFRGRKLTPVEKFTSDTNNFEFHTFVITVDSEFIPALNSEHSGYCWVPLSSYPKPLHPGVWRTVSFSSIIEKLRVLEGIYT